MYTRKIRATGETLTVARAEELGADATDGKWVTFCEDHKTLVNSATEKLAYYTHGQDFCDGCRTRIQENPTNAKVNLNNHKEARAYQEGMRDGLAMLINSLVDGGHINYLLEVLEANARPSDAAKLNDFYSPQAKATPVEPAEAVAAIVEDLTTTHEFTNEKDARKFVRAQGGPINTSVEKVARGRWVVTITPAV